MTRVALTMADAEHPPTRSLKQRALDELAVNAFYTPHKDAGRDALQRLLAAQQFPESERVRIEGNQPYYGL